MNSLTFYDYTVEDVELCPLGSLNKRKNSQNDVNDQPQKTAKRKKYQPKVVSPYPEKLKKFHPGSNNTPKPSTPKQRKSYVRKTTNTPESSTPKPSTPKQRKSYVRKTAKISECQRPLFVDDGDSISFPFLEYFKDSKVYQGGFENSTITNESAIEYNSLQSYQKMTSLSCSCLVESRRVGQNFPIMCKRKRVRRERISLVKLLPPFAKGQRSKSFVRKRKCWTQLCAEGNSTTSRKMRSIIKKIISLKKKMHRKKNKRDVRKKSGELVLYNRPSLKVEVVLDEETLRVWNLLVVENKHEENDEHKRRYWELIRKFYHNMVISFLAQVHTVQGIFSSQLTSYSFISIGKLP